MFRLRFLWLSLCAALPLYAQTDDQLLLMEYQQARAGVSAAPLKCGFTALATLHTAPVLEAGAQRLLKSMADRPVLPLAYVTADQRFRIHYTTTGSDAVSPVSTNGTGVPDFVYEAGLAARRAYTLLTDTLGMKAHAADNGVDGPEFDFYIMNLGDLYGETRFDFSSGAGPAYIVIDNDYGPGFYSQGLKGLRVTVAHEYFHAVQLNYYLRGEDIFFFEISSVWFEDFAYDAVNDYFAYLPRWFRETNLPLHTKNGSHEYGSAVWLHYLTKRLYSPAIVRSLWERLVSEPALSAMKNTLQAAPYELPLGVAMAEFYTWCFFTNYRADATRYFEEGESYPVVRFAVAQALEQNQFVSDALDPLAAKYYRFTRAAQGLQGRLEIATDPGRFSLTAIGYDGNDEYFASTGFGLLPMFVEAQARQDTVVFLVVNGSLPQASGSTNSYNLQLTLGATLELDEALDPAYPNPFRPNTGALLHVPYRIKEAAVVQSAICGEDGRVVWNMKTRSRQPIGAYEIVWDGKDNAGERVPSGVYVLRLHAGSFAASTKIVVINR